MRLAAAAMLLGLFAPPALAEPLAIDRPETAAPAALEVRIPSARADGALPKDFSGYGKNHAPAVEWSGAPTGARSFALFVEDPDAKEPNPLIHWVIWNIPPGSTGLPRGVRNELELVKPAGGRQGINSHGGIGWTGPHPPVGEPAHHYHVQVFALDRMFGLRGGAEREAVIRTMRGHVLARGETIVLYAEPAPKPPRAG